MAILSLIEAVQVMSGYSLEENGMDKVLTKLGFGEQLNEGHAARLQAASFAATTLKREHPRLAVTLPSADGIEPEVFRAYATQWCKANEGRFKDGIEVSERGLSVV